MTSAAPNDWTSGYVSEIGYTHGYYREMAPLALDLALLSSLQAPRPAGRLRYLELGFGQGLSLNIHAAALDGEFWGLDFLPAHAAAARDLARASGATLQVLDDSFAEFAARPDVPEFDMIVMHGTWSWISPENRRVIVDILRRKLAVGGVFFMSYNCTPGWSPSIPMRHLLTLHAKLAGSDAAGIVGKMNAAMEFAQTVADAGARYFKVNPAVAEYLKQLPKHDRSYLAHEYFNADWHPMPFSDVAEALSEAKLTFAASANMLDHVDALNLTADQQKLLAGITHPVLRQSVRDYCTNQQFRKDIWVRGPRTISVLEQLQTMRAQRFVLLSHVDDVPLKAAGTLGEAGLEAQLRTPVLGALAADHYAPKTVDQINALAPGLSLQQIVQMLNLLAGMGHVHLAQSDDRVRAAKRRCDALNAHLVNRALFGGDVNFLASPVTGAGVMVNRFQQLFLRSLRKGKTAPAEWANDAWGVVSLQGQRLMREGKAIADVAENIAEMTNQAQKFADKRLPVLRALQVA